MASDNMEKLGPEEAKARVTRRMRVSNWLSRGFTVLGLGTGIAAAEEIGKSGPQRATNLMLLIVAATVAEKFHARRSTEQIVRQFTDQYEALGHESGIEPGIIKTTLRVEEDGELSEHLTGDHMAMVPSRMELLSAIGGPLSAHLASNVLLREAVTSVPPATDTVGKVAFYAFGACFAGLTGITTKLSNYQVDLRIESCHRRIDNTSSGLSFEA